jgi:4-amino-4-deoxy-L-arabinose transferase-like glycosyltransferase
MKEKKKIKSGSVQKHKKTEISLLSPKVDDILQKRWVNLVFLGVLFLIAFLIRLSILKFYRSPLFGDAAIYAKIAWGLKTGHGLHWWSVVWSPFYPFMIFIFSFVVGSLETSAFAVSIFLGSLMVVPFFFLAKKIFNYKSAFLGSLLVVFFPALVADSVMPLSEATYAFFLLLTLLCGWFLISKRSYIYALLFGLLSGICYLTRPEFLVAFAFILLVFVIIEVKGRLRKKSQTFILLSISLLGFLILAFPYMEFMHSQTGHWILSGKTAHNVLKQKAYSKALDYLQQRKAFGEVLDGLTPDGEIKGKVLLGEESMLSFLTAPNFFGDYFKRMVAGVKKINLFFLPFLLLSLFYIFSWKVDQEGWEKRVFLLCAFSPILTMPIFFIPAGRLIESYSPLLILLSVAGILNIRKALANLLKQHKSSPPAGEFSTSGFPLSSLAILFVVAVLSVFSWAKANEMAEEYQNTYQALKLESEEFKKLGLWADQILPKDTVLMFLSGDSFLFYCNRVVFTIPFAPYERIVEFARKNKVNYLLVSLGKEASWREDLTFLLEPLKDRSKVPEDPRLRLIDIYQAPSGLGAVVYEFVF